MNGQINITGINLELTEALKNYVREKATKLFEHNDRIIRANFDLEYIPTKAPEQSFVAKSTIEIAGPNIVLSVTSADLYKSIDELVDKLIRQIRRAHRLEKEKRNHPQDIDIGEDIPNTKRFLRVPAPVPRGGGFFSGRSRGLFAGTLFFSRRRGRAGTAGGKREQRG